MKYFAILFFWIVLSVSSTFAQDYKKHKVEKGETVNDIAKKYKVTPYDIYRLNPDSKNGIKENATLLIPAQLTGIQQPAKEQPTKIANTVHEVLPKETLYSLSKKYNVTIEDIEKANAEALKGGLKEGQKIIIPIKGNSVAAQVKTAEKIDAKKDMNAYIYHVVEAGETKYSIAKKHNMTVQLIEEMNPEVKETLPLGYNLKLIDNRVVKSGISTIPAPVAERNKYIEYTVKPKETFYSLSKETGLTEEEIVKYNPETKDGLKEGMVLKFPADKFMLSASGDMIIRTGSGVPGSRTMADFISTLKKDEGKEIALLLPFNMSRVESDTVRSQLLRSDRFLNMTLDFYAGALIAIDSANTLGLPLKVRIMDSKETSRSSEVAALKSSLMSADAIIGPFFQNNVESTASMFEDKGIPVVSPLSKDTGKPYANLYQSVPTTDMLRKGMMEYLKSKNGNLIAIVDSKKASSRQFIKDNYPSVKFAALNEDGSVNEASLKGMLVKDKVNYIILETGKTSMVLNITRILTDAQAEYQLQLAVLERTETLDYQEIPMARLAALKMLYPSVTRENDTVESAIFAKKFREKNGVFPNQFATRGFDVTFDIILRLFQPEELKGLMLAKASEQVENRFAYTHQNGGNYNRGVYILQYGEDLSVKEAQ